MILNTVQSAAIVAQAMAAKFGIDRVEHLSTSLTPADRKVTLGRVKARLLNNTLTDWVLVATSCVEAGVDFSFRTGLRERCSLTSLVQIGGRVSRSTEFPGAEVWDFRLRLEGGVTHLRAVEHSAAVLGSLFKENKVGPEHCTEAMRREAR